MTDLLIDGPEDAPLTVLFAHGAGAPMDSGFMQTLAGLIAAKGWRVVRFEFPYMAERRATGKKRPPNPAPQLLEAFREVIAGQGRRRLVLAGKSMGGRMASLLADETDAAGLICFGYPFHPPGKPEKLRTEHLKALKTPTLILQGERDPFGTTEEVPGYGLSPAIEVRWLRDGNHDLSPRKASGWNQQEAWEFAAGEADAFLRRL
ncbi:alpha/beta fold hydrolase [Limibacillus halophilus]